MSSGIYIYIVVSVGSLSVIASSRTGVEIVVCDTTTMVKKRMNIIEFSLYFYDCYRLKTYFHVSDA